jgi:hypothetical protein
MTKYVLAVGSLILIALAYTNCSGSFEAVVFNHGASVGAGNSDDGTPPPGEPPAPSDPPASSSPPANPWTGAVPPEASGPLPKWYLDLTSGEWGEAPSANGTLKTSGQLNPINFSWPSGYLNRHIAITEAWNSAALNTVGVHSHGTFISGSHLILWGGGHADYDGNEVYAFGPINGEAPQWRRLRDATLNVTAGVPRLADGSPNQRHTYDTLTYVPTRNWMIASGAAALVGTGNENSPTVDRFDFGVKDPNAVQPWAALPDLGHGTTVVMTDAISAYDSAKDQVWHTYQQQNGSRFGAFDIETGVWTTYGPSDRYPILSSPSSIIDPKRGLWVAYGKGQVWAFNIRSPSTSSWYRVATIGSGPAAQGGILFDPVEDMFVVWANSSRTLYTLRPPANFSPDGDPWTWTAYTPNGGATPTETAGLGSDTAGYATGVFKRFTYVPYPRGYLLYNRINDPVFFFRPP